MFWTEYDSHTHKKIYIYFYFLFFSVSLYSVQNIAIHRIRLIFDSSNTLVYRDGPSGYSWRFVMFAKFVLVSPFWLLTKTSF